MTDPSSVLEKHNRIGFEIATRIHTEFPDPIDALIVLESITVAVIGTMPFQPDKKLTGALQTTTILHEGIQRRLKEHLA